MNFFKSLFQKKAESIIDIDTIMESEVTGSEPINFGEKICLGLRKNK
jgi:hypothetical protein